MKDIITVTRWAGYCGEIESYHDTTPAEIAAAHPKCGTCEHWNPDFDTLDYDGAHTTISVCALADIPIYAQVTALDYCRFHSELNKENDDDKPE